MMRVFSFTYGSLGWLLGLLLPLAGLAQQARTTPSRLALPLQHAPAGSYQQVRVLVSFPAEFAGWLRRELPNVRSAADKNQPNFLLLDRLEAFQLSRLAACPWVRFVDVAKRPVHEETSIPSSDMTLNTLAAVWYQFPTLTGEGLTASIKEQAFDSTDIDLRGRVVPFSLAGRNETSHATEMATFIAGAGNTGPLGRGAASHARVVSADFNNLSADATDELASAGVSVQNHSYGVAIENYYGLDAVAYDEQTRQLPALLHVFSSGNSGDQASPDGPYAGLPGVANLTGQFKHSKNTLSVGATNAIKELTPRSSRGPAYDGRLKPELVAYGAGGSSDAAALVSGAALLVQHAYRNQHAGALPSSALMKAILLNATDDVGAAGPDFKTGFGQLDALGAVQTVADSRFFTGSVANQEQKTFSISVPAGTQLFKLTLAWNDPTAEPNADKALVNDLDMELVEVATGRRFRPWVLSTAPHLDSLALPARRRADHLNNVEQITLASPPAGQYQVEVRGYAVLQGAQEFHLAYETAQGLQWTWPMAGSAIEARQPHYVRWQWAGAAATAALQYRFAGTVEWQTIATDVPVEAGYYAWFPPDTAARVQLRLQGSSLRAESEEFTISPDPKLRVAYYCQPQALLTWQQEPGTTQYQVYTLRGRYLEPGPTVTDTTLLLTDAETNSRYYAVAPLVQGQPGYRSLTVNYQQGAACYIVSFLPSGLVNSTVSFDVELASTYQLVSATLERQDASGFVAVQTQSPISSTTLQFADMDPPQGSSLYRVRLTTASGASFYSQAERVFYLPENELAVFPNPLRAGEFVRVAVTGGPALRLRLFDSVGRLCRETTADGVLNELSTQGLKPGSYLLRAETEDGRRWSRHVLVY
ncbi:S8 family serine peptidase [Hymenobacter guriensis]|uniref:S8 family serine peptidase n=1 Tax=Hymenobacter guriensis TaxID=2793065 RepID=A0ABS0KY47_9BACT|nr:S8 family serine peptidase [Hymenobacter guriensis]MBG8552790.1 S8 family serine peptidase [Hymenobacter guriensis]